MCYSPLFVETSKARISSMKVPMPFDRAKPFNELPLLPPAAELETKAVLKQTIAARAALADLKGAARQLPNQGVLIQALGLQEAKLSSEIENIVTTNDALFQGFANNGEGSDSQTKEVCTIRMPFGRVSNG